jgi:energy-coupling factor transporter ATP-binding protein EcfA2
MSIELLVGRHWIRYESLSSGQKSLCNLYYINKVITGVGILVLDEALRHIDDESLKEAVDLIDDTKKLNVLVCSHSSNLSMENTRLLKCEKAQNTTQITLLN